MREMLENWTCDEGGSKFGLKDVRHKIVIPPSKELEKLKHVKNQGKRLVKLKTYVEIKIICDKCFKELNKKLAYIHEIFGFE